MKALLAGFLLLLAAACSIEQAAPKPAPAIVMTGRVTDAAHVLDERQERVLSARLEQLERNTAHQIVVVTAPSLQGQDVAAFTTALGNAWGVGRKGHDDGVILLVAPEERKARIAVGYGLENALPDAECQRIMSERIIPRFRAGDLPGGIAAGVDALAHSLSS